MSNLKDTLTTILAVATVIITAAKTYLESNTGDIDYVQLALGVILAVGMYFMGKNANGTTKTAAQVAAQKEASK